MKISVRPDIVPNANDISVDGVLIGAVNNQDALLWRIIADAEHVYVQDSHYTVPYTDPVRTVSFELELSMFMRLINTVPFVNVLEHNRLHSWDEIDPSIPKLLRLKATDTVEWREEIDKEPTVPKHVPIIVIHFVKDEVENLGIQLTYYILRDGYIPEEE